MSYLTPADVGISDDRAAHIRRNSKEPGTDYRTAYGTDLRVPADGVVITVDNSNYGAEGRRIAFLLDDGRQVDWIHLASIQAKVGQRVTRGQRGVALSGASGYGKDWYYDPHVHVTLRARRGLPYTNTLDFENYLGGSAAGGIDEGDEEFMAKIDDLWQRWQPGQAGVKTAGDLYLLFAEMLTGVRTMVKNLTVAKITDGVWAKGVKRGGVNVSALQELADAKTYGINANQKLDELLKRPTASVSLTDAQVAALAKSVGEQVALSIAPKVLDAMAKRLES